ncbi:alpha/beta hydrolase [Actinokineospora xionganensis]|uniref:Alpha/beta-hydrolase family protein n=1 Tax=Actinokineospora xionganensis TaxID=2684470 RepID=A0ABR7KZV8_9PSEU|nr:alpha/beta-hydrolase family protein [Actinokineospora xionganensis]MBC6445887.1 alpha/beta-hydrolase family protein [Actinokineospora xionganensis]
MTGLARIPDPVLRSGRLAFPAWPIRRGAARVPAAALARLDFVGTTIAIGMFYLSVTPSLLPRPWLLQGVISGVAVSLGYLVGIGLGKLGAPLLRRIQPDLRAIARRVLAYTTGPLIAVFAYQGAGWQQEVSLLTGVQAPSTLQYLRVPLVTAAIFLMLLAMSRFRSWATRRLTHVLTRRLRRLPAACLSGTAVFAAVLAAQFAVVYGVFALANENFRLFDEQGGPRARPAAAELSGSAESLVAWDTIGRQGREFLIGGPTAADISRFTGGQAKQPIRAYAGRRSAPSIHDTAALAVRELERTGAFSRSVLCVVTTTGRGYIDSAFTGALEYMHGGDTAIVAIQYSHLPSWLSFLTDGDAVRTAGHELFDQVHARWSLLPVGSRPKLLVFGESLGALGADATFAGPSELSERADGVLLVGPPNNSPNRKELTAAREPGSTEALPVYDGGVTARFGASAADFGVPTGPWGHPRVGYLQHQSDPVVWWSPDLILRAPSWLTDRGPGVSPGVRWYPFITFAQLTADLLVANDAPSGYGHNYREDAVASWAWIAPPAHWTASHTERLEAFLGYRPGS